VSEDSATFHGNEGQYCLSAPAEGIYEVRFIGTTKRPLMDLAHRSEIIWSLPTDEQHASIFLRLVERR
jgi:hypothetical protein